MTFSAWFEFYRDPMMRRHTLAQRLYAALLARPRCFSDPIAVKAWAFAEELHADRGDIARALDLMIGRGYLDEHTREHRKAPRRVTVASERRTQETPTYSAA